MKTIGSKREDGEVVSAQVSGGVWSIVAKIGESVSAGQTLLVLESMKMEIAITAPYNGEIEKILCTEGQSITAGQALVFMRQT